MVFAYVDLLDDPAELYDSIVDSAKRDLLGAFFDRIDVEDEPLVQNPQVRRIDPDIVRVLAHGEKQLVDAVFASILAISVRLDEFC
ncbi:hypothetical protein ACWDR7_05865 [Microbacterium sp. NPDC003461]